MEANLIGISGKVGSGKDTVGAIIKELNPKNNYEIKKFADKSKDSAQLELPSEFNKKDWEDLGSSYRNGHIDCLNMSRREFLVAKGMLMRSLNRDYWVNALFSEWKEKELGYMTLNPNTNEKVKVMQVGDYPNWIVTDVRFYNEAKAIKDRGGIIIRVNRPLENNIKHISETSLDNYNFDYVIENDSDIKDLTTKVKNIFKKRNDNG